MTLNKNDLRKELICIRKSISQSIIQDYSEKICQQIANLQEYQKSSKIAYYHSINNEVSLNTLPKLTHQTFYLPKLIDNQKMIFCKDQKPYQMNLYRIPEPANLEIIEVHQLDIILLPLVGFDQKGHRLGMGKAFYDRALSHIQKKPILVGIAYAFQERQNIPFDEHDKILDIIITENEVFYSHKQC